MYHQILKDLKVSELKYSLVISILIKFIFFLFLFNSDLSTLAGDQSKYWSMTEKINTQNGFFGQDFGAMRVPIYIIFLSLLKNIYNNLYFVISIQLLLSIISLYIIYKIAELFSLNVAKITIILSTFCLGLINSYLFILTESIFIIFFLLFTFFLLKIEIIEKSKKIKYIILCGIFLGLATLTRPLAFYFFPIILIIFLKNNFKKNLIKSLIFLFVFSLTISPWCIRNYLVFGEYKLTNSAGPNLAGYYYPYLKSNMENISTSTARNQIYAKLKNTIDYDKNPFYYGNKEKEFFFEEIKNYPINIFLETWIEGNLKFLFTPSAVDTFYLLNIEKTNFSEIQSVNFFEKIQVYLFENENKIYSIILIFSIIAILIFRFFALCVFFITNKKDYLKLIIFFSIIFINMTLTGPIGSARYRIIVDPFLIILSAISLSYFYNNFIKNEK